MCQQSAAHLAKDPAALAVGVLHHSEDGEVPIVELAHQGLQVFHQQRLRGQDGFVLEGVSGISDEVRERHLGIEYYKACWGA